MLRLSAVYRKRVTAFAPLKLPDRKSPSGTIGALEYPSHARNAARKRRPAKHVPNTPGWPHPLADDSIKPKTTKPNASVARRAPGQSRAVSASSSRLSGTRKEASPTTSTARGTLMKKTHRHDPCSTSQPPSTGPTAAVMAVNPDHVPMARPRSSSLKDALIMDRLPGMRSAPPIPWIARETIS